MSANLVHDLLRASARRVPERPAVIGPGELLTYAELDAKSTALAKTLVAAGVTPGTPVGIAMHKCADAIIGVYGILKAGAAYVPIDAFAPALRSAKVVANTRMRFLLTTPDRSASLVREMCAVEQGRSLQRVFVAGQSVDEIPSGITCQGWYEGPHEQELPALTDTHLAYVLHTSGSTGAPKGVAISHRNALCFVEMAAAFWKVTKHDRLCSQAPLHFDLSVFDLYVAARAGASVVIIPEYYAAFPKKMAQAIDEHAITIWNSVVSTLTLMMERGKPETAKFDSLRAVIFSGEVMPVRYLRLLHQHMSKARLFNVYGQTEANSSLYYEIDCAKIPSDESWRIPLGQPFPNFEAFAIDAESRRIDAPGTVGELLVRASTVALGYWNNPVLSASKFVSDPCAPESGARVYRTGDMVRLDDDKMFVFCGRSDDMIKCRGYRIELGDIDLALLACHGIESAAAVALPDEEVGNRLFVFVTLAAGAALDETAIITHCRGVMPKYMIPERVYIQADLPRTSTSKIDRNALRALVAKELSS